MNIVIKKDIREMYRKGFEDIVYFHKKILQRDLHNGQAKCLKNMMLKDSFIKCGNRYGKGDIGLAYLAWIAFYKPVPKQFKNRHIDILNTSISQDQANIIFNKFQQNLTDVDTFSWMIKDIKKSPFPNIEFKNDVTWWFRNASQNGKYLEGQSYFHINFDESDLQDNYQKFVSEILSPRVWDFGGNLSHMTTPRRGTTNSCKVYMEMKKESERGNKEIYIHNGDSRENKFLHKKAIDKMNNLPKRLFNKNVLGEYSDSGGEISNELIDVAEKTGVGIKEERDPGYTYVSGWDLARSSTYCCGATLRIPLNTDFSVEKIQLVSLERFEDHGSKNRKYWKKVENQIRARHEKWGGETVIDKTGVGDVVYSYIEDIDPIGINLATARGKLRQSIIDEGIALFENEILGIPKDIEQVTDDEVWMLRDEISNFETNHLDVVIWDMVCAIFLAGFIATGHEIDGDKKEEVMPSLVGVRGGSKYGYR